MIAVLIIDDDVEYVLLLKDYLQRERFKVTATRSGETGVELAVSSRFAIAVIDTMTPDLGGMDVLRRIRDQSSIPVVMLANPADAVDRALGLELGADDFVSKPLTPRELTARLRAILRRTQLGNGSARKLSVGALTLWPERRRAEWAGQTLALTSTEYSLLEVLALNAGRTVSKEILSQQGLGRPLARYDRSVDVHLSAIRHKLGALADGRSCIQTVIRKGYQLVRE